MVQNRLGEGAEISLNFGQRFTKSQFAMDTLSENRIHSDTGQCLLLLQRNAQSVVRGDQPVDLVQTRAATPFSVLSSRRWPDSVYLRMFQRPTPGSVIFSQWR